MTDEQQPKLKLIQDAEPKVGRFSAENLRRSLGASENSAVTKKLLLRVPIRKPGRNEWFRVHPDPIYAQAAKLLEYENEFFFVLPEMVDYVPEARPYMLYTTVLRAGGVVLLWPVRLPEDGSLTMSWWQSGHEIAGIAKDLWVRATSNKGLQAYEATVAEVPIAEPEWPDKTPEELVELAFGKQCIDTPEHSVFKILKGLV